MARPPRDQLTWRFASLLTWCALAVLRGELELPGALQHAGDVIATDAAIHGDVDALAAETSSRLRQGRSPK